jgi:hypothetical protein
MESPLMLLDLTARQAHCIIECNEVVCAAVALPMASCASCASFS